MSRAELELAEVMQRLVLEHDVLPFMGRRFRFEDVAFQILPEEMGRLLSSSPDYVSPEAGVGPVWLRLEGPEEGAELVVYRAACDETLYVVAPRPRAASLALP